MNKKLKILVVDDSANHRRAAEILLKDHDLTVVGSYDEAQVALVKSIDHKKERELLPDLLTKRGLSATFNPWRENKNASDEKKAKYSEAAKEAEALATYSPDFDVVLLDLLMPASSQAQGPEGMQYVGKEMPVGTFLILYALNAKVKLIGMVTDMSHHDHPASACLDRLNNTIIEIGDTRIRTTNYSRLRTFDSETGVVVVGYDGSRETFRGKGWDSILETLLNGKIES